MKKNQTASTTQTQDINFALKQDIERGSNIDIESIFSLTPMQHDMYFISIINPNTQECCIGASLSIDGQLDNVMLEKAIRSLHEDQAILRTRFHRGDEQEFEMKLAFQCIYRKPSFTLDVVDCSLDRVDSTLDTVDSTTQDLTDDEISTLVKQFVYQPYDIHGNQLVRYRVWRQSHNRFIFASACHHILMDAISGSIHIEQILNKYQKLESHIQSETIAAVSEHKLNKNADYLEYITQHRNEYDTPDLRQYWSDVLQDVEPLSVGRPSLLNGAIEEEHFIHQSEVINLRKFTEIKHYCRAKAITPALFFRCIYALILKQYGSPTNPFIVNNALSVRPKGHQSNLGIYVYNLPFVFQPENMEDSVTQLLDSARRFQKESKPYKALSTSVRNSIVESSDPEFNYNYLLPMPQLSLNGTKVKKLTRHSNNVEQVVHLYVQEDNEGLTLSLSYSPTAFDSRRLLERITLIAQQLLNGTEALSSLNYVLPDELALLKEWNNTSTEYPSDKSLMFQFENKAAEYPEFTALSLGHEKWSYRELNQTSNQMARRLVDAGVKPGHLVAIALGRSVSMIVSTLAVLKVGGVYVPIDTSYPQDRIAYLLEDAGSAVLITSEASQEMMQRIRGKIMTESDNSHQSIVMVWEDLQEELTHYSDTNLDIPVSSTDLAYVMYTSGTTGNPKGVCVRHKGISRLVVNTNYIDILPGDTVFHCSNVSFDLTTIEIWAALLNGGELVIVEQGTLLDLELLPKMIAEKNIKLLGVSTSVFNHLTTQKIDVFADAHTVIFGAENADASQLREVLTANDGAAAPKRLINIYGPTENTTLATTYLVESVDSFATSIPIGSPIANSTVYILDPQERQVPIGVAGELYVGGDGVADRYLNQPEKTLAQFISDPFDPTPDARLYRTGDICRFHGDGNIELLGRVDDQVKLSGYRIELGEVESNLKMLAGVRDSCVLLKENHKGTKELIAYILLIPGVEHTPNVLKAGMKDRVPQFLVPSAYVILEQFPKTANGKTDKRALPEPEIANYESKEYIAPKNETEQKLKTIWQDILELDNVSTNFDFFDLGGHSLDVTRIRSRIKAELAVDLSVHTLFDVTTISGIAEIITTAIQPGSTEGGSEGEFEEEFEEITL